MSLCKIYKCVLMEWNKLSDIYADNTLRKRNGKEPARSTLNNVWRQMWFVLLGEPFLHLQIKSSNWTMKCLWRIILCILIICKEECTNQHKKTRGQQQNQTAKSKTTYKVLAFTIHTTSPTKRTNMKLPFRSKDVSTCRKICKRPASDNSTFYLVYNPLAFTSNSNFVKLKRSLPTFSLFNVSNLKLQFPQQAVGHSQSESLPALQSSHMFPKTND